MVDILNFRKRITTNKRGYKTIVVSCTMFSIQCSLLFPQTEIGSVTSLLRAIKISLHSRDDTNMDFVDSVYDSCNI